MTRSSSRLHVVAAFSLSSLLVCSVFAQEGGVEAVQQLVDEAGVRGGLLIEVGADDAKQTAALRPSERFLVQGLQKDAAAVAAARKELLDAGLLGPVTVIHWPGGELPYADGVVNLLVVRDAEGVSPDEVTRVLAPGGVALVRSGGAWKKQAKRRPETIDEWTHFLHAPDNNAVAEDTEIEPPHHLQWTAGPRWGRSHDHLASMSAAVSAAGRLFYIMDEGPVASVKEPSRWVLVARDAMSGVLLWKKEVGPWEDQLRPFRSGPAEMPRRLVAVGDRVYVTLGYGKPVTALDAATGEVIHTYAGTDNTHEILCSGGRLYLVVADPLAEKSGTTGRVIRTMSPWRGAYRRYVTRFPAKHVRCLEAETGKLVWKKQDANTENVMPLTPAVSGGRLFFENERQLIALSADSGEVLWKADRPVALHRYAWSSPTVVVKDGVVLSADRSAEVPLGTTEATVGVENPPADAGGDKTELEWLVTANHLLIGGQIMAFSAETGEKLWTAPCHEGFNFPVELFVVDGKVYSGEMAWGRQPGVTKVYDLHTGRVVAERPPDQQCYTIGFGHHRCYRNKATTKYLIHGRSGVEFLDLGSDRVVADHWIRGTCQYGILPCNGLLYAPPHSCACYITAKLNGFNALAPKREEDSRQRAEGSEQPAPERGPALVRGPAFPAAGIHPSSFTIHPSKGWPTYRHDAARSGVASVSLPAELKPGWEKRFAGPLSSVVVAGSTVFFAQTELHTVRALSAMDGSPLWQFTAGGRVDSPPTIVSVHVGRTSSPSEKRDRSAAGVPKDVDGLEVRPTTALCIFGSADGWVYCLRAADGALVWRYRAALEARQIVSYEQLESAWPVHGSVLVRQGQDVASPPMVCAVAGRSSFLDGGLVLVRLDARTGELLGRRRISHRDPKTGQEPQATVRGVSMPGALPDVLSTDGSSLFMRHTRFDLQGNPQPENVDHLFSSVGFLDGDWWHRTYWQIGTAMGTGYGGWPTVGNRRISGRLLVVAGERVFGFGRKGYSVTGAHVGLQAEHHLFSAERELVRPEPPKGRPPKGRRPRRPATQVQYHWSEPLPFFARAMLLAGDTLLVAGPSEIADVDAEKPEGDVLLWAVSAADGAKQAEYALRASPVFDGMAASGEGLFFSTVDGRVVCYRPPQ